MPQLIRAYQAQLQMLVSAAARQLPFPEQTRSEKYANFLKAGGNRLVSYTLVEPRSWALSTELYNFSNWLLISVDCTSDKKNDCIEM